ncbi:uncharacterized protein GlcG (DUF336 family) [Amycolatopsis jiangsuensis]|uniref:Uncharacterized protein GlcG (DUF336 family) n=1 Tax=Amycolatopsis jiangsuensis TaxID=1181879 RepID=A0A840IQQ4_9PSEU|nr:heme-binding protein [Amycolatopsis jiangsuensis]MBB4684716.1 uncharacterized protein GlcG (DUF336 family) [Amycolatopsis jiangsuensis]
MARVPAAGRAARDRRADRIDRFVPFGGGLPLTVEGQVVGGIGVSGGHWSGDDKIAQAAAAVLEAAS